MNLNKYDPRLKKYEELAETFFCGEKILKEILQDLTSGKNSDLTNQSWIITGQRGSGKSHLISLLYHEILRNETLNKQWLPLIFPEELFMVDSLYRLLIEILSGCFNHLGTTPEIKQLFLKFNELKHKKLPDNIKQKHESKYIIAKKFFDILKDLKVLKGQKFVLLLENIQYLFREQLSEDDLKHLRSFFHENQDVLIIIGTATSIFDQIENSAKPFYHFFRIRQIEPLDRDGTIGFLSGIASYRNEIGMQDKINNNRNYIYTYNILTGGNPRLILFLYELLLDNDALSTELILEKISELTPYFLDKIKEESGQRRLLLDACASGSPVFSAKEISESLNDDLKTISAQIKILASDGWIKEIPLEGINIKKSETFYSIKDYFFRIWYRLRMGEIFESGIYCMAELVSLLFDKEEIESRINKYNEIDQNIKYIYIKAHELINDHCYMETINLLRDSYQESSGKNLTLELPEVKTGLVFEIIKTSDHSNESDNYRSKAIDFLSKQDYRNAILFFDKALEIYKKDYTLWYKKGMAHSSLKEYTETIESLEKVKQLKPDYFRIRHHLALAYLWDKKFQSAIMCLEEQIKEDAIEKKRDYYTRYLSGLAYFAIQKYEISIKHFMKATDYFPDRIDSWLCMGHSYFQLDNFRKALECFNKAEKIDTTSYESLYWKGRVLLELHDYKSAIKSFNIAINSSPEKYEALTFLGFAYANLKKSDKAIEYYIQYLSIKPNDISAIGNLGDVYMELNELETAITYFKRVLQIEPDNVLALKKTGVSYYILQIYDKALEYFEKAGKINPDDDRIYNLSGCAYHNMKSYKKAVESFEKAISINPVDHSSWYQLSRSQFYLNEYENSYNSFSNFVQYASVFRSHEYNEIRSMKKIALEIFKDSEELKLLLDENTGLDNKIESICRLLLLGKFLVLTDSFGKTIINKYINEQKLKKLTFFLKAYILDSIGNEEDNREIIILFQSWVKAIKITNHDDISQFKKSILYFFLDFIVIHNKNVNSMILFEDLIRSLRDEYNVLSDTISQIIEYLKNPDDRESIKNITDPLFVEIIDKIIT